MTQRKKRPAPGSSAPVAPHVRIADRFYGILQFLTPLETKLYLAFRFQAWRKDGQKKHHIGKTLRRIAQEINMPYSSAHKAAKGLQKKNLVIRKPVGFVLVEQISYPNPPVFDKGFDMRFDTNGRGEQTANKLSYGDRGITREITVITTGYPSPNNPSRHNRLQPGETNIDTDLYRARRSRALEGARSDALSTYTSKEEGDERVIPDTSDMSPKQAKETLEQIKRRAREAIAAVEQAQSKLTAPTRSTDEEQLQREAERRAELKRQAAELEKAEKANGGGNDAV